MLLCVFQSSSPTPQELNRLAWAGVDPQVVRAAEWCHYLELPDDVTALTAEQYDTVLYALGASFNPRSVQARSFLADRHALEFGPRPAFETAWGSSARSILDSTGVEVLRWERTRRLGLNADADVLTTVAESLIDRMTEQRYLTPPASFLLHDAPEPMGIVPLSTDGLAALKAINQSLGLAMTPDDMKRYQQAFATMECDPTDVEVVQLAAGNSEHSRHPTFRGRHRIDGVLMPYSLMNLIKAPYKHNPNNSLIAFYDDASCIRGGVVNALMASGFDQPGALVIVPVVMHTTFTAETHCHPTFISPYDGAMTGNVGRVRDNESVGRGGLIVAQTFGIAIGALHIPGHELPWEQNMPKRYQVSSSASPLEILIEGTNGAFFGANCLGEPLIVAYLRSFAQDMPDGSHVAYAKSILYSGGLGSIMDEGVKAEAKQPGMPIVQIGGPAFRIGIGGVNASSMGGGENNADLDFASVQRGDPEMARRVDRVVRACVEMRADNPIVEAHDIGGGGATNVYPELVNPLGGRIDLRAIPSGDATLSVLELWTNESQERNAYVIFPDRLALFQRICERYGVPCAVVGEITNDGRIVVVDSQDGSTPVDLPLSLAVADDAPASQDWRTARRQLKPLELPDGLTVREALDRVLRHPTVASKGHLTSKVDRSVTGLVAQQSTVGPFQLPLSNFGAKADSMFGTTGAATSIGEQPIVGLISAAAGGRMSVGEALTNLMGARISRLQDIRASGNWMWPIKLEGEGPRVYEAAEAIRDMLIYLGAAVDGGKDSSSLYVKDEELGVVKAPGTYVFAPYAPMPDVTRKVTPEFKRQGNELVFVDLATGRCRLGGSMLAQVYEQIGDDCPDVNNFTLLRNCFNAVMELHDRRLIVSLHDKSDGGLVTTLLEMAFAGGFGADIDISSREASALAGLFNQELGVVLECASALDVQAVLDAHHVPSQVIGTVGKRGGLVSMHYNGQEVLNEPMVELRKIWMATSTAADAHQGNPETAEAEAAVMSTLVNEPQWELSFRPQPPRPNQGGKRPRAAVLVAPGSNGDRELAAMFIAAGFDVDEVTMSDLREGRARLDPYRGLLMPGGFSYADVLGSAHGWATEIRRNQLLAQQFEEFRQNETTFSFSPCNGFQLATLLGWVGLPGQSDRQKPRLVANRSARFESRLVTVQILDSSAIALRGMAGSRLGVVCAHGEGRLQFASDQLLVDTVAAGLAPMRYVDFDGEITEQYPFNPNGSPQGIAGLVSPDDRHFGCMPHPERHALQMWQYPWLPKSWESIEHSPWLQCALNLRDWCTNG